MRLLLDEMIGPRVALELRRKGVDCLSVIERAELRGLPDEELLRLACADARVVVSRNISDFARLDRDWQATSQQHHGLVLIPEQAFPQNRNLVGALVAALLAAVAANGLPAPGDVLYLRPVRQ